MFDERNNSTQEVLTNENTKDNEGQLPKEKREQKTTAVRTILIVLGIIFSMICCCCGSSMLFYTYNATKGIKSLEKEYRGQLKEYYDYADNADKEDIGVSEEAEGGNEE